MTPRTEAGDATPLVFSPPNLPGPGRVRPCGIVDPPTTDFPPSAWLRRGALASRFRGRRFALSCAIWSNTCKCTHLPPRFEGGRIPASAGGESVASLDTRRHPAGMMRRGGVAPPADSTATTGWSPIRRWRRRRRGSRAARTGRRPRPTVAKKRPPARIEARVKESCPSSPPCGRRRRSSRRAWARPAPRRARSRRPGSRRGTGPCRRGCA
jgi:hypothetical protein